jgi:hypothetical protein
MGIKGCYEKRITGSKHGGEQIRQNRGENSRVSRPSLGGNEYSKQK